MTLKGHTKFKGKLTRGLKNDIRNLVNFHASSLNSEYLHFDGILLPKAYKNLDGKLQKNYLMALTTDAKYEEKLALGCKNDITNLVNFNKSSGKPKNLHFDVQILLIAYKVSAKKVQQSYLS